MKPLWHYTCDHGHAGIQGNTDPRVVPATYQGGKTIGTPGECAWFTDLAVPIRDTLGLTSHMLTCDRTAHRYRVLDTTEILPWRWVRRTYTWGADLESAPGARCMHWYVATEPVPVVYDPIGRKETP